MCHGCIHRVGSARMSEDFGRHAQLGKLDRAIRNDQTLQTILDNGYAIASDLFVERELESVEVIQNRASNGDYFVATQGDLWQFFHQSLLYAVISCK